MNEVLIVTKILGLASLSFIIAFLWAPFLLKFLNKYTLGKQIRRDANAPIFQALHQKKEGTLTMGGILIWATTVFLVLFFWLFFPKLNFLSRKETFLPLASLIFAALVGLVDDLLVLEMRHRLWLYAAIAAIGAWWFYAKLEWRELHLPFWGDVNIDGWYIAVFLFIIIGTAFSVNESDGLDGLAGGLLLIAFLSYAAIAFVQKRFDLAIFCATIIGSLLAFLWYNIYPARFFMGDTGAMSLGVTIGVIAMLTNTALYLPFILFIPMLESLSVIIQISSKKILKRKIFLSAPLHHHFEAKNWPETQITMRFWIINLVTAIIGLVLFLIERQI